MCPRCKDTGLTHTNRIQLCICQEDGGCEAGQRIVDFLHLIAKLPPKALEEVVELVKSRIVEL